MTTERSNSLELVIITPNGIFGRFECDSVIINIPDGKKGNEAGAYGLKKGHISSSFLLAKGGKISASLNGKAVLSAIVSDGFANAEPDSVTVTVDKITLI